MTVSTTTSRVVYLGDGEATVWDYSFKVATADELVAVYTDPTGTDFILSSGQYDVTGIGSNDGGKVTYPAAASGDPPIPSGTRLTIYRDVPLTQLTSIGNQGAMWPQVIETALDRLTWLAQQLQDQIDRTFRVSTAERTGDEPLALLPSAEARANAVLGFDSDGQPYAATLDAGVVSWSTWIIDNFRTVTSASNARSVLDAVGRSSDDTITGTKDITGGRLKAPTRSAGDNGTDVATTAFVKTKAESAIGGTVLRAYLAGLGLANNSGSPNTRIDVAAGVCADDTNVQMLPLPAGTIDCATTGANGLDTGSLANSTWYHVFAIGKTDGTVARLASTSAGSPTLPSGYTLKRRLGSFRTNGSAQIVAFSQNGDQFLWTTPQVVLNDTGVAFPTSLTNLTMVVPTGVVVDAIVAGNFGSNTLLRIVISALAQTGASASTHMNTAASSGGGTLFGPVRTDTSGRIQWIASGAGTDQTRIISTHGWIDRRGRDS